MRSTSFSRLKLTLTTLLFLLTLSLLTACGGSKNSASSNTGSNGGSNSGGSTSGGSNPGNTGGSGGSSQSASTFVYVSNTGTKQLQAFSFNGSAFTQIQGSPYTIGSFAPGVAIADSTLTANAEGGNKTWTIDASSGALTPGPASPGWGPAYGNTAYGTSSQGITAYSVNNGTVTQIGSPVSIADLCFECTGYPLQVSGDGKYVFVMLSGFHDVNGFAVLNRASDGSISNARFVSGVNGTTSAAAAVVVSKDSRYIYEFNQSGTIQLWQFDPAAATATQLTFKAASPSGIAESAKLSPDGKYLVGVFPGVNRIDVYSIDSATGALTPVPGSPFATGTNPTQIGFSSDSQTLFVDCRGDGSADLFAYHIGADGSLMQVAHQSLGGNPSGIAVK
ncbi:MAG TPA: hypothetical protein VFP40_16355 [Terriglobales bacterium]|nr:hypothetical protein [Terriglobales bacterium]